MISMYTYCSEVAYDDSLKKNRTLLLLEAGARHNANSSCVEHLQTIQKIRLYVLILSSLDGLLRQENARECVQSSLDFCADNVLHLVESSGQLDRATFQRLVQSGDLLLRRMYVKNHVWSTHGSSPSSVPTTGTIRRPLLCVKIKTRISNHVCSICEILCVCVCGSERMYFRLCAQYTELRWSISLNVKTMSLMHIHTSTKIRISPRVYVSI